MSQIITTPAVVADLNGVFLDIAARLEAIAQAIADHHASTDAGFEQVGVVLDTVADVKARQDGFATALQGLATVQDQIVGTLDGVSVLLSAMATDLAAIKARLDELEAGQPEPEPEPEVLPLVGVNFAGLGNNPDVDASYTPQLGTHYRSILDKPGVDYISRYKPESGKWLARIPYAAERLFAVSGQQFTFKQAYLDQIKAVVEALNAAGATVLLDMHNYCRWWIKTPSTPISWAQRQQRVVNGVASDAQWIPIGHALCPVDYPMLARMHRQIAEQFKDHDVMYGLMNEPHSRGALDGGVDVQGQWIANAQSLVNAVREFDTAHYITVGGCDYSTAKHWRSGSDGLKNITDPAGKLLFEAHQYPDTNPATAGNVATHGAGGGKWDRPQPFGDSVDAEARVQDWADWVQWLQENGLKGFAGEFGGPADVANMPAYLEQLNAYFDQHGIPRTQWLAGPGDADSYANGMDTETSLKPNATATTSRIGSTVTEYGPN